MGRAISEQVQSMEAKAAVVSAEFKKELVVRWGGKMGWQDEGWVCGGETLVKCGALEGAMVMHFFVCFYLLVLFCFSSLISNLQNNNRIDIDPNTSVNQFVPHLT